MPLTTKLRRGTWQAVGRVEYNGRPITGYQRLSTGASTEAGAWVWIRDFEERQVRRHLLGDEAEKLTFGMAVLEYKAKPVDAGYPCGGFSSMTLAYEAAQTINWHSRDGKSCLIYFIGDYDPAGVLIDQALERTA